MFAPVYSHLVQNSSAGQKLLAVLIDPDHTGNLDESIQLCAENAVDLIFLGGSLLTNGTLQEAIETIKSRCNIPVLLFPGDEMQIDGRADALLLLSLISGRNAELLIGKHVVAAPYIKKSGLEVIPTGYMLVDGGRPTTASYISNTSPLPADKPGIAACTAMAGEMLGLKLIYMDAGSGAQYPVSEKMIKAVADSISLPLVVGGGIRSTTEAINAWNAGADIVVVGNAIEHNRDFIGELAGALLEVQKII